MMMSTPMSQEPAPKPLLALQTTTSPTTDQEECHHHHHGGGNNNNGNTNILQLSPVALQIRSPPPHLPLSSFKKSVKYMECLKNHAAAIGGSATDGCGEFMPGGDEGTLEALKCSACNCHRNFHRKIQLHPEPPPHSSSTMVDSHDHHQLFMMKKKSGNSTSGGYNGAGAELGLAIGGGGGGYQQHQLAGTGNIPSSSDGEGKKRFRTKFSQEQKEKMQVFAERAGWKIQKLDDTEVRSFCQEIGIKRKVLKVWMHNNKYHFAKKTNTNDTTATTATT